eukprot:TRINITY_DN3264_c0_g1_i2.p2 TRINITY_DN3264_c0_g1~~TRINITY_DN3264_c0_g1_i2.p2  ORF type:complete len:101 (-),score=26.75 TRINITY_DN3264_c0_g1_i2:25-327(-)
MSLDSMVACFSFVSEGKEQRQHKDNNQLRATSTMTFLLLPHSTPTLPYIYQNHVASSLFLSFSLLIYMARREREREREGVEEGVEAGVEEGGWSFREKNH